MEAPTKRYYDGLYVLHEDVFVARELHAREGPWYVAIGHHSVSGVRVLVFTPSVHALLGPLQIRL